MSTNFNRVLITFFALMAVVAGLWLSILSSPKPTVTPATLTEAPAAAALPATSYELPPIRPSRFLNTNDTASYVGGDACRDCHAEEYKSYLHTAHSQALGEIDLEQEPPDAEFHHAASGRSYRIYRQGEQLRHRESRTGQGDQAVSADYALRYVIGSGHHSRSYIVETDGFLVESPVTWYTSTQQWAMSPNYDRRDHRGFERMVDLGCLFCHAGRVGEKDDSRYRVAIREQTIGCESCHGPGSLHIARHRNGEPYEAGEDLTIVNPNKLSRERNESVCGLCHLRGTASVWMHGRDPMGFRPGLLLSDFRVDYQLDDPDKPMKVVGHIEQMKLSRCYQESGAMTCTTCHDPHGRPAEETKWEYFKQKCMACHDAGCGLELQTRLQRNAEDNCVACHMPQSATDIPHFAFTHHRVGFHDATELANEIHSEDSFGTLVPMADVSHLPAIQQDRSLGMAYLEISAIQASEATGQLHRQRAAELLTTAYQAGLRDALLEAMLAGLAAEHNDFSRAVQLATAALQRPACSSPAHATALLVLGQTYMDTNNLPDAKESLERLVDYRRNAEDWVLLAVVRGRSGDAEGAIAALEQAGKIQPFRADVHQLLAEGYRSVGRPDDALRHQNIAESLTTGPR